MAIIIAPLSTIETDALSAKRPSEFSTPDISATIDMQSRYGIVMRVSSTDKSNFCGTTSKPGAKPYNQPRHRQLGDDRYDQKDEQKARHRVFGELARCFRAVAFEASWQRSARTPN